MARVEFVLEIKVGAEASRTRVGASINTRITQKEKPRNEYLIRTDFGGHATERELRMVGYPTFHFSLVEELGLRAGNYIAKLSAGSW
jgi:hypothetical protein